MKRLIAAVSFAVIAVPAFAGLPFEQTELDRALPNVAERKVEPRVSRFGAPYEQTQADRGCGHRRQSDDGNAHPSAAGQSHPSGRRPVVVEAGEVETGGDDGRPHVAQRTGRDHEQPGQVLIGERRWADSAEPDRHRGQREQLARSEDEQCA